MFFRELSTQAEYFNAPERSAAERAAAFRELDRINQLFRFHHPFSSHLPSWLGKQRCASLDILDVGAGTGLLGRVLSEWAARRGWDWRFTKLDLNPIRLQPGDRSKIVAGSALELPFPDRSFDLVVASQMTHHLSDQDVVQHWREAWRVTWRRGRKFPNPESGCTMERRLCCKPGEVSVAPDTSEASATYQ